jgi:hypothetical protein
LPPVRLLWTKQRDIALLVPPYQLTFNLPLPDENPSFQYGQDAFFLGFPYNFAVRLLATTQK